MERTYRQTALRGMHKSERSEELAPVPDPPISAHMRYLKTPSCASVVPPAVTQPDGLGDYTTDEATITATDDRRLNRRA